MFFLSVFIPLICYFFCIFFNKRIAEKQIEFVISALMTLASLLSIYVLFTLTESNPESQIIIGNWLSSGSFSIDWSLNLNRLSVLMVLVVNIVSTVVHIYSIGYMHSDPKKVIFLGYLGFLGFFGLHLPQPS